MRYGSVCSGIEAASVAWHPLGWKPAWFAEIEPFPSAVLAHRFPEVDNLGDMTQIARRVLSGAVEAPDLLVGGTPCQAFSVAGMRAGLDDPRGQLTIKFVELADAIDHVRSARGDDECIVVWENVPGVLSDKGNAFGCFLGALVGESGALEPAGGRWSDAGCVYGPARSAAWRVLDAQYFGLAQRRRRVFVVASARDGFDPAAVLFERDGVRRDTPPSREAGQDAAGSAPWRLAFGGENTSGPVEVAACLLAHGQKYDFAVETFVAQVSPTLDASYGRLQGCSGQDANHGHGHLIAFSCKDHGADAGHLSPTLRAMAGNVANGGGQVAVCVTGEITHTLKAEGFGASEDGTGRGQPIIPMASAAVRRLTPRECERLQGFPDDWTLIPWRGKPAEDCPDGPRYKAIGNSKAVPVVNWIGNRIELVRGIQ